MGKNAVYIAVQDAVLDALWQLGDEPFRDRFLELEEDARLARLDIAKIWDALHCTLTGVSASSPIDGDKLSEAIVGVHPKIYDDEDYSMFVSVIDNSEIAPILAALKSFDSAKLASSVDLSMWKRQKIYPRGIWDDDRDDLITEMNDALDSLREFFDQTRKAGHHLLATIL